MALRARYGARQRESPTPTTPLARRSGARPEARLAEKIPMPTSPDTLLRRVKQAKVRPANIPRYVGIDDWAWRKGQRYGTIVVDLETHNVIDLLPDRDAATVRAWLEAHPGVELVSRDRSSAYSQAASEAAPSVPGHKSCKEFRERVWQTIAASSDWSTSTRRGGRRGGCTPARTPPHE